MNSLIPLTLRNLFILLAVCNGLLPSLTADEPPAAIVAVAPILEQEVASGQTFVATISPLQRAVVGSPVDGRVIEMLAREGDRVEGFKPLVQLLTSTIDKELAALEAELRLRQSELDELRNGLRPAEIEQARAKMLGAKANMEYARSRFERLGRLGDASAVSQEELSEAEAVAIHSEQNYLDLKAAHQLAVEGPRVEQIAQAESQVAQQQAMVDRLKGIIHRHAIITRFDGYVIKEHTEVGAWVKAGDPVMEVIALDDVKVEAFVTEQQIPFVKPGMTVRVEVPALPNQMFSGVVMAVNPQADTKARTFPVQVRVTNEITDAGPTLKAGMYARVELPTGRRQQALMVSKDALVLGGPQPTLFVFESGRSELESSSQQQHLPRSGMVRAVPVELGVATEKLIQVKGDLTAGQFVVVEGNERLKPGQSVRITETLAASLNSPDRDR